MYGYPTQTRSIGWRRAAAGAALLAAILAPGCAADSSPDAEAAAPTATKATEIVLIGTLHRLHLENPDYPPEALAEILIDLHPDVILVELPDNRISDAGLPTDPYRDSTPENWAAIRAARHLGRDILPYDRPDRDDFYVDSRFFARSRRASRNINAWSTLRAEPGEDDPRVGVVRSAGDVADALKALMRSAPPRRINSAAFDHLTRAKHRLVYEVIASHMAADEGFTQTAEDLRFIAAAWQQRNAIMARRILEAAADRPGGRIAVLTGCEHRYLLRELLADLETAQVREYWQLVADR